MKQISLKNSEDIVILDKETYDFFVQDEYYNSIGLLKNLRKHSSGCAVFQKTIKNKKGVTKVETLYLHKLVAEIFLPKPEDQKNNLVGAINDNKLDCRKENLIWRSRSWASRQRKTTSQSGFMGVYQENKKFRAVISHEGKSIHLGMFNTAEEAARAYNRKSWELYGHKGKQNKFNKKK